jgi:hypothetical protein
MSKRIGIVLTALLLSAACVPTVTTFSHSPDMAAQQAKEVAREALIERDFQQAYGMLADNSKANMSFDKFVEIVRSIHPMTFPITVMPTEYEPIPGQRMIKIYLYGENGDERFYYCFELNGDAKAGYKVFGIWRQDRPYPPAALKRRLDESL